MSFDVIILSSGVVGAMFILLPMKELKKEYYLFSSAALALVIFVFALKQARPIFAYVNTIKNIESSFYIKVLIKVLGISIVTGLTSELAEDLGMQGVCHKVEFAGKVGILLSALPIYDKLIELIGTIL